MRPYIPGEDLTGISVNKEDIPELGGMIAENPKNPEDRWYVAKKFFEDNYFEAPENDPAYQEAVYMNRRIERHLSGS
jgi:hypothetical protein